MRLLRALLVGGLAASAMAQQPSTFALHGTVAGRGIYVSAAPSWMEGAGGRFDVGADSAGDHKIVNVDVAQLGFDWTPLSWLSVHADGVARHEPSQTRGNAGGIVQAYVDIYNEHWSLRAGSFWLPTSRENVDPFWNSRYSLTYSALNSWIGTEVRPIGVDLQYTPNFYLTLGATAFRGNDTMGTELAAHGWTFGNRIAVWNEGLPEPGVDEETKPFTRDLDSRTGFSGRIRVSMPERAMLQVAHIDNRAELIPYIHDLTPWRTEFNVVSGSVGASGDTTVAAEWAYGWTTVGFVGGSYRMDYDTAYVLLSHKFGTERITGRIDRFNTHSHVRFPGDAGREDGHAVMVAWLHQASKNVRTGIEWLHVTGDRPGLAAAGVDPRSGGSQVTLEVRYGF